jgi:hypothetical protein
MEQCNLCFKHNAVAHDHHIIPREYGGVEGPELHICPTCHDSVHRSATNPLVLDEFLSILPKETKVIAKRLIEVISNHKAAGIKTGTVKVSMDLPRELHNKLKQTASDLNVTQKQLLLSILNSTLKGSL